jgi:mannosyl-3-phosphoglycerate phosphatase
MPCHSGGTALRSSTKIVYIAIDNLISPANRALTGFPEFLESLAESRIPLIWVTSRSRMQMDAAIRKYGHSHPFIAEGGCGVYLPEDYFHLKPPRSVRLGRFTCIPIAEQQPAAAEALELLSEDTGVSVVPLRSLSPRELEQNTGLKQREADLLRQRDFDEVFFFAGASDADIQRFGKEAAQRKLSVKPFGSLWSFSVGAQLQACVQELSKLFDRAFRAHAFSFGIASAEEARELFPTCNRAILLTDQASAVEISEREPPPLLSVPMFSPGTWEEVAEAIISKRS